MSPAAAPRNTAEGTEATSAVEQCKDRGSSSAGGAAADLKAWGGRWPDGAGREREAADSARSDGRTRCSPPVCALALFEKTSWAGQQRSRGVGEQRRHWAVREGANSKGAEKYEGNKGKSVGAPFFPLLRFYSYNSLCSLAPKPRRTLQVLAGVNGAFLIVFSSATVDQVARFGSGVVLGNL